MRRLTRAVLAVALIALGADGASAATTPPPPVVACDPQLDVCGVEVVQPGGGGSRPPAGRVRAACEARQGASFRPVPCSSSAGTWSNALQCYLRLYTPPPPLSDPVWQGHADGAVYLCTTALAPSTRPVWLATAPAGPTPEQLALQALSSVRIPAPVVRRSPSQANRDNGSPYTWVNLWTWWWTTPQSWRPREATARAGGVWATVTVTPSRMVLDPGDGSPALTCAGPGRAWTEADADLTPGPEACAHRYTRVTRTGPLTAALAVDWTVTWIGSGGSSGTLAPMRTTTSSSLVVQQIQVVTR